MKILSFHLNTGYLKGTTESRLLSKLAQNFENSEAKSLLIFMAETIWIYVIQVLNNCTNDLVIEAREQDEGMMGPKKRHLNLSLRRT